MELVLLEMLQQRSSGAMDDALRNTGGAGRIQDVERVIEGKQRPLRLRALSTGQPRIPSHERRRIRRFRRADERRDDNVLQARQGTRHVSGFGEAVELLAAIDIPVNGEKDGRCDLAEPIEHALHAEVRRT